MNPDTPTTETPAETPETEPQAKKPDTTREKTQAPYRFTFAELSELGKKLSQSRKEASRLEEELSSIKADYKSKVAAVELEQDSICRKLDDGFEMREAFAIVTFNDPTRGRKTYRHEDTGEFIREEAMTHSDYQLPMFRDKDGKDATAPAESTPAPEVIDGQAGEPVEGYTAEGAEDAGTTPVGEALDAAAFAQTAPAKIILDIDAPDWTDNALVRAYRKAAKAGGWSPAQVSAMDEQLKKCSTVEGMKLLLKPHVVAA